MNEFSELKACDLQLKNVCVNVRDLVAPLVTSLSRYSWIGPSDSQTLEFVKRAAIVRQFEATEAILALIDAGHGAFGVTMLRPAYEELLWIEYLGKHEDVSIEIVRSMTRKEVLDSYSAQKEYLGQRGIRNIGFTSQLSKRIEKGLKDSNAALVKIGASLGWRSGASQPSVAYVARSVGREKQYKYLYQGTSRAVHFSPQELQRRVWGSYGAVTISSSNFENYWSDFALSWSFRILIETLVNANFKFDFVSDAGIEKLADLVQDLRPVQILTASELEAWNEPHLKFQKSR